MKPISYCSFLLLLAFSQLSCQDSSAYQKEISLYQYKLNNEFADPVKSPLLAEDRLTFHKLPFFTVQEKYRVEAELIRTPGEPTFEMETTTERRPVYRKYGEAHFEMDGKKLSLNIYQNVDLNKKAGYENHLFLPFGDLTNGSSSYGGGRFIDLEIPEGDKIVIDFNKAYNPYCAYNHKYSCPIPPPENRLDIAIEAGVMAPPSH